MTTPQYPIHPLTRNRTQRQFKSRNERSEPKIRKSNIESQTDGMKAVSAPIGSDKSLVTIFDILDYQRDVLERSILFFDTLRRRANEVLDYEAKGHAPVLNFKYETVLDARTFEKPCNYALLKITDVGDDCWDDCVDPSKPPVIVMDPRAGHGPGIGGFKRDSEVGISLHIGHPTYFVVFFSEPCPNQTLSDVLAALRQFIEFVATQHEGRKPILYGNCQAGWAATLVSAHCPDVVGAAILNGSPLSYWSGEPGVNPMRLLGGMVGGVWLSHFLADLNQNKFDGAWLVQNFESLKPGNALWDKYASLFAHIDTESDRFLAFERWWNAFYQLSGDEIVAIVRNLFIGNKLEDGKVAIDEHCVADLRAISNPLIIFASYGDNITPPQQALGWIPAVYKSTEDLEQSNQRIVYLTNPHIGHLGIFVSAKVARFEHRAILEHMPDIKSLAPGLYEMSIDNPTGDPDCAREQYSVQFKRRRIEDVSFPYPRSSFENVKYVSERNEFLYRSFISPWVQMIANPYLSAALRWMHPMRTSRYIFSERIMPWMIPIEILADAVSKNRHALSEEHPFIVQERKLIDAISAFWEVARKLRDTSQERVFETVYGTPHV